MACNAGPDIIEDGLVLCLDAANINSYPKSGTTWSDLVGSNNGTMQSMSSDNYSYDNGGSLIFDGASDYVSLPENGMSYPNTSSDFTLEVIAKINVLNVSQSFFQQEDSGGTGRSWLFFRGSSDAGPFFSSYLGGADCPGLSSPSTNTIYHLHLKYESGTLHIGDNGIFRNSITRNIDENSTGSFRIGSGKSTATPLNGNIYSVKIYNRALTGDEVRQNYEATVGRFT
jgi:hypothetical protein